jgi:hypothetical protein
MVNVITCKNMSRHLPTFIAHSVNMWGMMRNIVGLMTSCMKDQETHIEFKVKYSEKEILRNLTPQEEETSTLVVDLEEEDEEEAWVKVEVRSFVIAMHNQDIWQGTIRTLVPLAATATHLNMLLKIVLCC